MYEHFALNAAVSVRTPFSDFWMSVACQLASLRRFVCFCCLNTKARQILFQPAADRLYTEAEDGLVPEPDGCRRESGLQSNAKAGQQHWRMH